MKKLKSALCIFMCSLLIVLSVPAGAIDSSFSGEHGVQGMSSHGVAQSSEKEENSAGQTDFMSFAAAVSALVQDTVVENPFEGVVVTAGSEISDTDVCATLEDGVVAAPENVINDILGVDAQEQEQPRANKASAPTRAEAPAASDNDADAQSGADSDKLVPVADFARALGYTVSETGETVTITRPFQTARLIVKSENAVDTSEAEGFAGGYDGIYILQYENESAAKIAYRDFSADENIEFVEPDMIMSVKEGKSDSDYLSWGYGSAYSKMTNYATWLEGNVNPLPEVTVAVVDSGVDNTHEFFAGRVITDRDYDFVFNDDNANDDVGHGTHVAGTICEGTLSNVKILPVRVLDAVGFGYTSTVVCGIEYAVAQGADVINLSLGGFGNDKLLAAAVDKATQAGVAVVVAAGNDSADAKDYSPAGVESAITVAALSKNNRLASFSNYGEMIDISAAGENINSSIPVNLDKIDRVVDGYEIKSGTSMAAPHVAAAAAMLKSANKSLTSKQIVMILRANSITIPENASSNTDKKLNMAGIFSSDTCRLLLGETNISVYPGGHYALSVVNYPSSALTWSVNKPGVATVSQSGVVTGVSNGSCTVTVSGNGLTRQCAVSVATLTGSADKEEINLYKGQQDVVEITTNMPTPISWSSANEAVVTVDSGVVTAIGEGTATVNAVIGEGSPSEKTLSVLINVSEIGDWYVEDSLSYTITTPRELYELAVITTLDIDSFKEKTVTLANDLDLSSLSQWLPIGNEDYPFMGTFDGGNHVISNLRTEKYETCQGLFGDCGRGSVIKNVRMENLYLKTRSISAGITGYCHYGTIDNCTVSGHVETDLLAAGGIVGINVGGTISNCSNFASVRNYGDNVFCVGSCGGIVYQNAFGGEIVNCINYGEIDGPGIVNIHDKGFSSTLIFGAAESEISPIIDPDNRSVVANCVSYGTATDPAVKQFTSPITHCFWLEGSCPDITAETAEKTAVCPFNSENAIAESPKAGSLVEVLNGYVSQLNPQTENMKFKYWTVENGKAVMTDTAPATVLVCTDSDIFVNVGGTVQLNTYCSDPGAQLTWRSADTEKCTVDENGVVTGVGAGVATVIVSAGGAEYYVKITVLPQADWYTEHSSPYYISSAKEFLDFAQIINNGIDSFEGETVCLANDIDISEYKDWTPVGIFVRGIGMRGTFDGQGHTINGYTSLESEEGYTALFNCLFYPGEIKNLVMTDVAMDVSSEDDVTKEMAAVCSIVGTEDDAEGEYARITNCRVYGEINPTGCHNARIGGICSVNNGIISDCINNIDFNAKKHSRIGGICNDNKRLIVKCVNNGDINFEYSGYAGGIAYGSSTYNYNIQNTVYYPNNIIGCVNNGKLSSTAEYIYSDSIYSLAGIVCHVEGTAINYIRFCINHGNITVPNVKWQAAGIAAENAEDAVTFTNCVNTGKLTGGATSYAICANYARDTKVTVSGCMWLEGSCDSGYEQGSNITATNCTSFNTELVTAETVSTGEYTGTGLLDFTEEALRIPTPVDTNADDYNSLISWSKTDAPYYVDMDITCAHTDKEQTIIKDATCSENGQMATRCTICGKLFGITPTPVKEDAHLWVQTEFILAECYKDGRETYECIYCHETKTSIRPWSHIDENNDYYCDWCGYDMNPEPVKCSCICHKGGIMGVFYKIARFFWMIFKKNRICDCGNYHY